MQGVSDFLHDGPQVFGVLLVRLAQDDKLGDLLPEGLEEFDILFGDGARIRLHKPEGVVGSVQLAPGDPGVRPGRVFFRIRPGVSRRVQEGDIVVGLQGRGEEQVLQDMSQGDCLRYPFSVLALHLPEAVGDFPEISGLHPYLCVEHIDSRHFVLLSFDDVSGNRCGGVDIRGKDIPAQKGVQEAGFSAGESPSQGHDVPADEPVVQDEIPEFPILCLKICVKLIEILRGILF